MIELPAWAVPNAASPSLIDAGGVMRSPINTVALKVNRPGSHYRVAMSFPPFEPEQGRVIVSRLIRAQREGLRVPFELPEPQAGTTDGAVRGNGQAGRFLAADGLTPGALLREGWWLSIVNQAGHHFLHNSAADAVVDDNGRVTLELSEALRWPFVSGAAVQIVTPMIEGLVDGSVRDWQLSVEQLTEIAFVIEEAR